MPADDMRAKQWPALAAGLNGHGASPKWRPAVVDQRARQTFDRPLLVPEHVRWKLSVEELFDPVDDANRGERISTEGKKIVLHANRRHVQNPLPDPHELHFHGISWVHVRLPDNLEFGRRGREQAAIDFAIGSER